MVSADGVPLTILPKKHAQRFRSRVDKFANVGPGKDVEGGLQRAQVMSCDTSELADRKIETGLIIAEPIILRTKCFHISG
jgi:hypothetical protein